MKVVFEFLVLQCVQVSKTFQIFWAIKKLFNDRKPKFHLDMIVDFYDLRVLASFCGNQ